LDAATSVFVSANNNVTNVAGPYQGQEIVSGGFVSDNVDKGEVWCLAAAGNVRIVVQETVITRVGRPKPAESIAHFSPLANPDRRTESREESRRRTRQFGRSR